MNRKTEKRAFPRIGKIRGVVGFFVDMIEEVALRDISKSGASFFVSQITKLPKISSILKLDLKNYCTNNSIFRSGTLIRKSEFNYYFAIKFHEVIAIESFLDSQNVRRTKILIVDDEDHIRYLVSEEFTEIGYKTITASDGYNLLERIEMEGPDLVILDIKMVDYDGLDILQDIRNKFYDLPVVLNTAYDSFKENMKSIAADFYVIKSFDLTELKNKVAMALSANESSDTIQSEHYINSIGDKFIQYFNTTEEASLLQSASGEDAFLKNPYFFDILYNLSSGSLQQHYSIEDFYRDFRSYEKIFQNELQMARKKIRSCFIRKGFRIYTELSLLYDEKKDWVVLSRDRFAMECKKMRKKIKMETTWLEKRLEEVLEKLRDGEINEIRFEELKGIVLTKSEEKDASLEALDLILADVRHDLLNAIRNIKHKVSMEQFTFEEDLKSLDGLYSRLADIGGFKVKPTIVQFDLTGFIKEQIDSLGLEENQQIDVLCDVQPSISIISDKALLGLSIRNILRNASEAIQEQQKRGKIRISASHTENMVKIVIKDNGPGIQEDIQEKVFDRGFTRKKDATGIGLTMTKIALNVLSGKITMESSGGRGTTIIVSLPGGE